MEIALIALIVAAALVGPLEREVAAGLDAAHSTPMALRMHDGATERLAREPARETGR